MRGAFLAFKRFFSHIAMILLLIFFVSSSLTLAYLHQVDASILTQQETAQSHLLKASTVRLTSFEQKNAAIEAELKQKEADIAAKQTELDAKKSELDKASQDLTAKVKELNSAKAQLSTNASELNKLRSRPPLFVFNVESSHVTDIEQKKADVKQVVTDAYDVISDIYSQPYLLHSVTISFVDSFTNPNAAAEIVITNGADGLALTIKIKDFDRNNFDDVNSIIHETIHSFHGLAVLESAAYEEGITVAATDAVMERLIAEGKIPSFKPLYVRIDSSAYASSGLTLPSNYSAFYTSSDVGMYYQLAGYGWYQLYKADHNFFKNFNETVYAQKREGKVLGDSVVLAAITSSTSQSIQGKTAAEWIKTKAFVLQ